MKALHRKALRDLWRMRGQALAIALVIASGIAMLVMAQATLLSLRDTRDAFYRETRFSEVWVQAKRVPQTMLARLAEIPGVAEVETRLVTGAKLSLDGFAEPAEARVQSLPDDGIPRQNRLFLQSGRLPAPGKTDEVLVGTVFAKAHGLQAGDTLQAIIYGRQQRFTIVGTASSAEHLYLISPGAMFPDDLRYTVLWLPERALAAALNMKGAFNEATFRLAPGADAQTVIAAIDRLLARYGTTGATDRMEQVSHRMLHEEFRQLATLTWMFPAIFLAVAAFLLNMVFKRLISMQRDQVAILKAFGYRTAQVAAHYGLIVSLICLAGVILGTAAGVWMGQRLAALYQINFHFPYLQFRLDPQIVAVGAVVSLLAALLGSGRAVYIAAREPVAARLAQFVRDTNWHRLPQTTHKRLAHILPAILQHSQQDGRWHGLGGMLDLISAISGRSSYITMLAEQPALIAHLHNIANSAVWLIQYIAAHPLVLDDITNNRRLPQGKDALAQDLAARLQNIDDEETWQHALRDYKHVQTFKTAWADTHGHLPLMQVSDQLSHIAETTLQAALDHAESTLRAKHGTPRKADGSPAEITIIGYGKLGGLELGYGSDLDLVYLYDDGDSQGMTDGAKPIDNQQYYSRLAQRTTNLLGAPSSNGITYDIDTRLRPGGASGLPAHSIQGFARYQRENAWTWEHQALTRSRPVAGSPALAARYNELRQQILTLPAPPDLRAQILAMREKMHANHPDPADGSFHLKQSAGGLIDIEFIVQYLLLAHGAEEPVLCRMSDNIRQLAALEATGILTSSQAMTLRDAYRKLRFETHHRQLNDTDHHVPAREWQPLREQVIAIWQEVFAENPTS